MSFNPSLNISTTEIENIIADVEGVTINDIFGNGCFDEVIVAKDEKGLYFTSKNLVGTGQEDKYKTDFRKVAIEKDGKFIW